MHMFTGINPAFFVLRILFHIFHLVSGAYNWFYNRNKITTPMQKKIKTIAIIGGGASGLSALKTFLYEKKSQQYDHVVLFEKSSCIGGTWKNDNTDTLMYDNITANTNRFIMSFSDFPMPSDYPDYPDLKQVNQYLNDYAIKFSLFDHILLNTTVINVEKTDNQQKVTFSHSGTTKTEFFDAVVVATGHFQVPNTDNALTETYTAGNVMHASQYKNNAMFNNKSVLIIGLGCSGAEIAAEISQVAKETYVSCKPRSNLISKYVCGIPFAQIMGRRIFQILPMFLSRLIASVVFFAHAPSTPSFKHINKVWPFSPSFAVSSDCISRIGDGKIIVTLPIESYDESQIVLPIYKSDEKLTISPDYVIVCTGYSPRYDFLNNTVSVDEFGRVTPLYKQVFYVDDPTLCFIGLPCRVSHLLVNELQARWIDSIWSGEEKLPGRKTMIFDSEIRMRMMRKKKMPLKYWHHTDAIKYMDNIAQLGGFYPDPFIWSNSKHFASLLFGPVMPNHYRMHGRGKIIKDSSN